MNACVYLQSGNYISCPKIGQKNPSGALIIELEPLWTTSWSLALNLWPVKDQAFVLSPETDCSSRLSWSIWNCENVSQPTLAQQAPTFLWGFCSLWHLSSFSPFTLILSASRQTQASFHPSYSLVYILILLPSHTASDHLHYLLSSCLACCPFQSSCHTYEPLALLKRVSLTHRRLPSYPSQVFTLYEHRYICLYCTSLSITFIPFSQPSLLQTLVHDIWYMMLSAAYILFPLRLLNYNTWTTLLFAKIFLAILPAASISC